MSKKPGLYANIHAKRKRGEKMRQPGEEGAPSAQDFKNAAKTAKKKKNAKRQDPGTKMYDKDGCKMCDGGKKPCRCGKADMGRKAPYADGCGYSKDSVAEEINGILINDAERADKPCGNSYIPQSAKCSKGAGQAKQAKGESGAAQYAALSDKQKEKLIRQQAKPALRNASRQKIKQALEKNKGNTSVEGRAMQKAAKRELFNRNVRNVAAAGLYLSALHSISSRPDPYKGKRKSLERAFRKPSARR